MDYRTPLSRVLHYGSAHSGTGHFWRQRLTAAANVPLVLATLFIVVATIGRPYPEAVAFLGTPWVAVVLILLFVSVTIHMRIGMQVVIEDYVQGEAIKVVLLVANTFFCVAVAAVAILSVVTLAVGVING
jgi:succinate dehydrogenase / fumarate reductase membrane anchor subunit